MGDKTGQQGQSFISWAGLIWFVVLFSIVAHLRVNRWV